MLRGNKLYWEVNRANNLPDSVIIDGKEYIIRFSAKHAQHIVDNAKEPRHDISFAEIVELIKNSIVLPIQPRTSKRVAIGRHKGKMYETYFYLTKGRIDVITSYNSGKHEYVFFLNKYENGDI